MEFMINNNVEFVQDAENNYIATICIRINNDQNNENKKSDAEENEVPAKQKKPKNSMVTPPTHKDKPLREKNSEVKRPLSKQSPFQGRPSGASMGKTPGSFSHHKAKEYSPTEGSKPKKTPRRKVAEDEKEYERLLSLCGRNTGMRPKRMNIGNLISCMEDLYTARFIKDTSYFKAQLKRGNAEEISDKPFPDFIYEFYKKKHKANKKNVQQSCLDLVCSIEYHKKNSHEAGLFASFLSQKYDTRDLVFFLYTRCLLEKEIGVKFSSYGKVNPIKVDDPREVNLGMKTCRKIARIFFEEDENELANFLASVQRIIDENHETTGQKKIQCVAFLILLLEEFHVSKNTNNSLQRSIDQMESPFEGQEEENYQEEKYQQREDEKLEAPILDQDYIPEDSKEDSTYVERNQAADELKDQILNHISDNRISQLISFMLKTVVSRYEAPMDPEMMNMLEAEIKEALFSKISDLLESLFVDNLEEWLRLLMIEQPNDVQLSYYEECRKQLIEISNLGEDLTLDNIDDIAKMVLQTPELKQELAKLINTLVSQVQEPSE